MADKEDVQVAHDPVSGEDTPGVAGDEAHRSHENDQPADGPAGYATYSAYEQARAGDSAGGPVSGDEMVARKQAERRDGE